MRVGRRPQAVANVRVCQPTKIHQQATSHSTSDAAALGLRRDVHHPRIDRDDHRRTPHTPLGARCFRVRGARGMSHLARRARRLRATIFTRAPPTSGQLLSRDHRGRRAHPARRTLAAGARRAALPRAATGVECVPRGGGPALVLRVGALRRTPWLKPLVGAESPLRVRAEAGEMSRVLAGLRWEWESARDPRMIHHWIGLLHGLLQRFARPWHGQERLWRLW